MTGSPSASDTGFQLTGIDHVQLAAPAGCEVAARAFFGQLLGMPEIPKPEELTKRGGVWFQCGMQELHIGVQSDFVAATKAHPAFCVSDIASLRTQLLANSVSFKDDMSVTGVSRIFVNDPFGNRLEFLERV